MRVVLCEHELALMRGINARRENLIDENATSIEYIETLASILAEDADVSEFFGLASIAHTNIVLKCIGRTSKKVVEITIPYDVIKKYCKVPSYLLS